MIYKVYFKIKSTLSSYQLIKTGSPNINGLSKHLNYYKKLNYKLLFFFSKFFKNPINLWDPELTPCAFITVQRINTLIVEHRLHNATLLCTCSQHVWKEKSWNCQGLNIYVCIIRIFTTRIKTHAEPMKLLAVTKVFINHINYTDLYKSKYLPT